jgi:hypothetical protein
MTVEIRDEGEIYNVKEAEGTAAPSKGQVSGVVRQLLLFGTSGTVFVYKLSE